MEIVKSSASRLETRTRGLESKFGLGLVSWTRVQNESKNLMKLKICNREKCSVLKRTNTLVIIIALNPKNLLFKGFKGIKMQIDSLFWYLHKNPFYLATKSSRPKSHFM